jgi:hypothetical protein
MLDHLQSVLQAKGFKSQVVVEAGPLAPLDQIVVALHADEKGRERSLWLTPLPHLEEDFDEGLSLLQILATLPFQSGMETESDLDRRIVELNNKLPLGCFGHSRPDGAIFYRQVLMLGPDREINGMVVGETIVLMNFLLDQFSNEVEQASGG